MSASLSLAGCVSTRSAKTVAPSPKPIIAMPDSELLKACGRPVEIPNTPLVQKLVEKLWISDRQLLINCAKRQGALADYVRDLIARLEGKK
jgi:hypothetical protein